MSLAARDLFTGDAAPRAFSARLAAGERPSDEDVRAVFAPSLLDPFRVAEGSLRGRVRKVTGEPAIAHPVDVALRAQHLRFPSDYLLVCLLHDVVEDSSDGLEAVARNLYLVRDRFGDQAARDIRVVTNRYSVILESISRRVSPDLPFKAASLALVGDAVARLERELPEAIRREFAHEFSFLLDHFLHRLLDHVDFDRSQARASLDLRYNFVSELVLQTYHAYVVDLADDSRRRLGETRFYDRALVCKACDVVDNQRTASLAFVDLERSLLKAEIWLDRSYYLLDHLLSRGQSGTTTFGLIYEYVKLQVVEQAAERGRALSQLADTRFSRVAEHVGAEVARLQAKYCVGPDPIESISRLTREIQARNAVHGDGEGV